jgi:nitroreductase
MAPSTNETLKTIADRHSVRIFKDIPPSNDLIEQVLNAANLAPSAHNQQSWRFIIITGDKKRKLTELTTEKAATFPRPTAVLLRMAARSIASAPVVIGIANTGDLIKHGGELFGLGNDNVADFFRTMEIQSSAAAVQNLLLAATSLGLATVWLGILFLIKDDVLKLLDEPQGEFMAVVPMGYPEREVNGPRKKPLQAIVKYMD